MMLFTFFAVPWYVRWPMQCITTAFELANRIRRTWETLS